MESILKFFEITYADITAYLGLVAIGILTINIILGILVSIKFKPKKYWPLKKNSFFDLHNWTGYIALFVVLLHPISLLLSMTTKFKIFDVFIPIKAPFQPLENSIGALAFYSIIFVVVTSYFRSRIRYRFWKRLHFVSYAATVFMLYHGIFTDPSLADKPIDYLDGGKVFTELCLLVILGGIFLRIKSASSRK